jgi:xanthine dehydrogenase YagT iron-sulfur-binding subunit
MDDVTRREFVGVSAGAVVLSGGLLEVEHLEAAPVAPSAGALRCSLTINGELHNVECEPRVTLLDLLRDRLHLTGTKKGCDHGQCGACTVLVNGARMNSCLMLAVAQDGSEITTIEGVASLGVPASQRGGGTLHPMQAAFIERDGFQCGFCTSGQICSALGMLKEWRSGSVSSVTTATLQTGLAELNDSEIRERMAGNICRCGAYPNIVAAIRDAQQHDGKRL